MKFDTVIIGGGLAGLVCGIYLSECGQRCAIVSSGQSAMHFSSGSLDLLNALPDGQLVQHPLEALGLLETMAPSHPYVKIGKNRMTGLAARVKPLLEAAGVPVVGNPESNHYRVTPMGTLKPTWLTLKDQLISQNPDRLPWKKIAIFNVTGFLDFYTQFVADEFRKLGTLCAVHSFSLPALEQLRKNPTEMRSVNIARVFQDPENMTELIRILKKESGDCEAIILPAVFGLEAPRVTARLEKELEKEVCLIATLPPSVPGIRTQQQLSRYFRQLGGVYMLGDTIRRAEKEGNCIVRLYSDNHKDIPFLADQVVLASGSYFSQGLVATPERVYEPVFDLDVSYSKDRGEWYDLNVFAAQRYQRFGVKTDQNFRALYQGQPLENLYVAGAVLEGFDAIREGCGAGVSILSAMYVAERILNQ